ncbi:RHS repeat-associated core domain-containing protein, partial [Comamonas piscis]
RNHLMIAHQERSGPEHHYAYDRYEPGGQAIEQRNQEGLDYRFAYEALPEVDGQPRRACVVTDSLGRVDKYIFQGEAGLARLVEHIRADGSTIKRKYNQNGHLSRGNRVQSLDEATGRKLELMYDSGNQLVQVVVTEKEKQTAQQYRYDAFGRRLVKYNIPANSAAGDLGETDYFGWDGDRLIHTERFNSANVKDESGAVQPEVIHTIYEPGSFTPLVQLRRASKAEPDLGEQLLANTSPGVVQDALRSALADIKDLSATLPQNIAFKSMSKDVQAFMREQLQDYEQTVSDQRKEAAEKIEIRHYLCDHLGTPNALIREDSRLDWAVQLDAWGNVRAEHNPGDLYQPIRLPGQHADGDTGLYYNRHRYYESRIGRYISPDPIGIFGGANLFSYVGNTSNIYADPLGLVRWSEVVNNGLGILGNTGGAVVGVALLAAPEPTTLTKIAGGAVLSKSIYGLGTSWYGFTRAFSDDSEYDISPDRATLSRTLVCFAGCNEAGRGVADALDLGLDLVAGKIPVSNKIKLPINWGMDVDPPWKQPVSSMFTNTQNNSLNLLQGSAALQSMISSTDAICKK